MKKVPVTEKGLLDLKEKLDFLKNTSRKNVLEAIKTARAHGDLKENAEYHSAKEEQYLLEKKIKELEEKILYSEVIDINKIIDKSKIVFGATVELENLDTGRMSKYKIVGDDEADLKENLISINSPLAKAILLKTSGDVISFVTISGKFVYKVCAVYYI